MWSDATSPPLVLGDDGQIRRPSISCWRKRGHRDKKWAKKRSARKKNIPNSSWLSLSRSDWFYLLGISSPCPDSSLSFSFCCSSTCVRSLSQQSLGPSGVNTAVSGAGAIDYFTTRILKQSPRSPVSNLDGLLDCFSVKRLNTLWTKSNFFFFPSVI